ncbi:MAG: phosphotransferase, partial [Caldilineaceae bacterium]|nr:phosphotransferase [Caldilineaceae bacterium]
MMTLRLMQAVVATVSEQWESPLADEVLQRWDHNGDSAKFWRASTNFVFFFKQAGQDCVLRFNHADERTLSAMQGEIDFVNGLATQGIPVAKPIRSRNGHYVESVATALGTFYATAFEALQGEQWEVEDLTPQQFVAWGQALGALHNASAKLTVAGRPTWQDHLAMAAALIPAQETAAHQTLEMLRQQLHQLPVNAENFGLIHYDFELDNLIWDGETAGIIDF